MTVSLNRLRQWPLPLAGQLLVSVVLAFVLFRDAAWALSDVTLYYQWTALIVEGQVPYRDFFFDYPPLSLPALLPPRILALSGDLTYGTYLVLFATWMAALAIALTLVVRAVIRGSTPTVTSGLRRHLVLMTLSLPVLLIRYDLWPILLVALAFLSTVDRRPGLAGVWLGIGIAAKLYPVVLLPVFAAFWWFSRGPKAAFTHVASTVLVTAIVMLPFVLLAGDALGDTVEFQQGRGLQIETVAGALIQLVNLISPESLDIVHTGTYELVSDRVAAYLTVQSVIAFAAMGAAVLFAGLRLRQAAGSDRMPHVLAAMGTATLIVFILTNRALSPQHVFWCLSFAALLSGYRHGLLIVIIGLTLAIFPLLYEQLLAQEVLPILLLNLRNALLAVLAMALFISPDAQREADPAAAS